MGSKRLFDKLAERYDAWFESDRGEKIFEAELDCLRRVLPEDLSGWTEAGVGSGRFAGALGIKQGFDPSLPMLKKAKKRGIEVQQARAEKSPFATDRLAGILLVVTLCFLNSPQKALAEFSRILKPGGLLLVGLVPADSPWGKFYQQKKEAGHPFYSPARFYSCQQAKELAENARFKLKKAASTLPAPPQQKLKNCSVADEVREDYGFSALLFELSTLQMAPHPYLPAAPTKYPSP